MVWERRQILIWGKTPPELSRSHKETVCTGGVFRDSKHFVRLYPIPLRYLEDDQVFSKYQWIDAYVQKSIKDPRRESFNIRCEDIKVGESIPTNKGDWSRRAEWITEPEGHVFRSVEALQAAHRSAGTSIGLVKPFTIADCRAEAYTTEEQRAFSVKYQGIVAQREITFSPATVRATRPLPPPAFRFKLKFRCDDPACEQDHVFSIFDWEVDALYNRLREDGDNPDQARSKVIAKLRDDVCGAAKDTYLFLGNLAAHPAYFHDCGTVVSEKSGRPTTRAV